jgi:asparagine synthase (glutamine-hydrolysing)
MCGVLGALLCRSSLTVERLASALGTIEHRGPDQLSYWFSDDRQMVLGHTRLSIIGLGNGGQPLRDEAGEVHCVVNGELYGYREIRAQLISEGFQFDTESDSEIALRLYQKLGAEFVHQLRGEFGVVIADQRQRRLIAVRDRFGIKPLFYAVHNGSVYVGSEIKALIALGVPGRWDREAFFSELHCVRGADRTLFDGVYAVPPGCLLFAHDGRVEIRRYWDMDFATQAELAADTRSDGEVAEGLRAVLDDAVGQRMVADVEVASYLSGGIDSCAVLGLAQRRSSRPIRAFTITFGGDERYDESALAERTATWLGAKYIPIPASPQDLADAFPEALWHTEALVMNGHGVAKYLLSEAVRKAGIKVVFTGEGSDELFAGYPHFRRDMLLYNRGGQPDDQTEALLAQLNEANTSSKGLLISNGGGGTPGLEVVRNRLGWVPTWVETFSALARKTYPLLDQAYLAEGTRANPYATLLDSLDVRGQLVGRDPVNQSLYLWNRTVLPNYILSFLSDRMEMAHSVEGRVPLLDHRVAEFAARLPVRHKIRGMREKHVLREAVQDCVLPEIYNRQKHPFMSPPARDSGDPMAIFCQDVLRSSAVQDQPFFDPAQVRGMMDKVATLTPDDRAAYEGMVLRVVSTCLLQQRFGLAG